VDRSVSMVVLCLLLPSSLSPSRRIVEPKWTNDTIASAEYTRRHCGARNSAIVASFKCARPPNTLMTFMHNATGRSCEVERAVCYFIIAPRERKTERERVRQAQAGEGNRDSTGTTRTEIERIALWARGHCQSSRGPSPSRNTWYCLDLNNIPDNAPCAFRISRSKREDNAKSQTEQKSRNTTDDGCQCKREIFVS